MRTLPALAAIALLGCGASTPPGNPLFAGADPSVLVEPDGLWIFPTGRGDRLVAWSLGPDGATRERGVMIRQADIGWIKADGAPKHYLWAPHLVRHAGSYYLYYSIGPQDPTPSRIGVAVAARPEGPYRDSGKPLVTGGNGFEAIDAMVFRDPASGRWYLYAGGSNGARLRVWLLNPDLVTLDREVPIAQPPRFTEGPFMHVRNGAYYLSYSQGSWQRASYSAHYSTASSPTGPWTYRGAILTSNARYKGPGHHSIVTDPERGEIVVYHRWEGQLGDGPYRGRRQIAIDRLTYRADGTIEPVVMTGR